MINAATQLGGDLLQTCSANFRRSPIQRTTADAVTSPLWGETRRLGLLGTREAVKRRAEQNAAR